MSLSREEFLQSLQRLPQAKIDGPLGQTIFLKYNGLTTRITTETLQKIHLGKLLTLPQLRVQIEFDDTTSSKAQKEFLTQFQKSFHRGGG